MQQHSRDSYLAWVEIFHWLYIVYDFSVEVIQWRVKEKKKRKIKSYKKNKINHTHVFSYVLYYILLRKQKMCTKINTNFNIRAYASLDIKPWQTQMNKL